MQHEYYDALETREPDERDAKASLTVSSHDHFLLQQHSPGIRLA
jgi:hypothetical protein